MNRRSLLKVLAGLPLVGALFRIEGVSASPVPARRVYAAAGATVTCANGHPICEFAETVYLGDFQDLPRQLGNWRQAEPVVGQCPIPGCARCGAAFTDGTRWHFADGWRRS